MVVDRREHDEVHPRAAVAESQQPRQPLLLLRHHAPEVAHRGVVGLDGDALEPNVALGERAAEVARHEGGVALADDQDGGPLDRPGEPRIRQQLLAAQPRDRLGGEEAKQLAVGFQEGLDRLAGAALADAPQRPDGRALRELVRVAEEAFERRGSAARLAAEPAEPHGDVRAQLAGGARNEPGDRLGPPPVAQPGELPDRLAAGPGVADPHEVSQVLELTVRGAEQFAIGQAKPQAVRVLGDERSRRPAEGQQEDRRDRYRTHRHSSRAAALIAPRA